MDRHLVSNDIGSNYAWPPKRVGVTTAGVLWCVYITAAQYTRTAYSNDAGVTWNEEVGSPFSQNRRNPSLDVDGSDRILVSGTNSSVINMPKYNIRDGSWGSEEAVSSVSTEYISLSQVLATSGGVPYCVWRQAPASDYTKISANKRNGSWGTPVVLNLAAGWKANSLTACMDGSDNIHVIWSAQSTSVSTNYEIQTAYWDGSSWSAITTIESYSTSNPTGNANIRLVGSTIVATWTRDGVGVETSYPQVRYAFSTVLGSWGSPGNITDFAGNHYDCEIASGYGSTIYAVYTEYGADPGNPGIANVAHKYWTGSAWSSKTVLTTESANQRYPTVTNYGATIHVLFRETSTTSMYHGSFDTTPAPSRDSIIQSGKVSYISPSIPGNTIIVT